MTQQKTEKKLSIREQPQLYSPETGKGIWVKREIFQNMPLEKTVEDLQPFCSFTKDVNILSELKEQE